MERREPLGRAAGDGRPRPLRRLRAPDDPRRRDPRPLGHAGDRLLPLGPEPRHRRGPGHLPDRHRAARVAQGQDDPRLLRLRLQLRVRDLRRRDGHLLGPQPRRRIALEDPGGAPGGRAHRTGARRHRRRLGVPVRPRRRLREALARRSPNVPGLDAALPPAVRAGCGRGCELRGLPAAVPGHGRPEPAEGLRHRDHGGQRGGAPRQRRGGRPARRDVGQGVHGPRPGLRPLDGRSGEDRAARRPARDAGAAARRGRGSARPRDPPRRGRSRRPRRCRGRHRGHAPRRERARGDRARARKAPGGGAVAARGRPHRDDLRPFGSHPAGDRHPEARARAADADREPGDPALPRAHPLGDRADPHHPGRGRARVHPDVAPRHLLQHHVARGHRDLDRRAGGRGDRRGRERLQEARDLERRGPQGRLPPGAPRGAHGGGPVRLLLAAPDRRGVHPRLRARRPGRAALQAARVDQEPHDADGGAPGAHAGSRAAHALHAHGLGPVPPALAVVGVEPADGRALPRGGAAPREPSALRALRARVPLRPALAEGHDRGRARGDGGYRSRLLPPRPRVHAPAQRGHSALHAHDAARASASPRPRACSRSRTGS